MIRVAIIGSAGQLGTDLTGVLSGAGGYEVSPITRAQIEVTDPESVQNALGDVRPDVVINCAAFVRVDDCEDSPERAFNVNATGAMYVARASAKIGAACVYISTDYVFDGEQEWPYTEEDTSFPIGVYGASKLAGEQMVRSYCPRHLIVRTSGLYGVAGSSGKGGNFVETMLRMARDRKTIRVVDDQVLTPTYTKDLANRIKELLEAGVIGLYHVTNSGQCSWYEFAGEVFKLSGVRAALEPTTTSAYGAKARRPAYSVLAHESMKPLDIDELRPWPEALEAYLREKGWVD